MMKAVYNSKKKSSFYKKERERIESRIDEPMLELVLQYLPHHQPTEQDQLETWEMVAIDLNNYQLSKTLNTTRDDEIDEVPTLTGLYIKEIYQARQDKFDEILLQKKFMGTQAVKYGFTKKTDLILYELNELNGCGVELLAKVSLENLENRLRARYFPKSAHTANGTETTEEVYKDTPTSLQEHKDNLQKLKLEIYEQELSKKNKRISQMENENKKLLDLNHDLLLELQELREKGVWDCHPIRE